MSPGGVRVGAPALTTRGMKEPEFRQIADFMDRAAKLALKIQKSSGKMLKEFAAAIEVQLLFRDTLRRAFSSRFYVSKEIWSLILIDRQGPAVYS